MTKLKFYQPNKTSKKSSKAIFEYDKRKDGWTLLEEGQLDKKQETLEIISFLENGESYVTGTLMRKRAIKMGGLVGQHHAEQILKQVSDIPDEWKKWYLVFPGTTWRNPDGDVCVPYLFFYGDEWVLDFRRVGNDGWNVYDRVVRVCK